MEKSNNKKRILALIEILKKESNATKRLKLEEIILKLNEYGIEINNRKTLYDDIKVLNDFNINVEYDNGYYLLEAPFNLSEIKIIIDSLNSLKNLDSRLLNNLSEKLYSFVSNDEKAFLEKLTYIQKHKDSKLLMHMENILESIDNNCSIDIKTNKNNKFITIFPIFMHRENDYYYLYCHYPENEKIYHYRFDNIKDIKINENDIDTITITKSKINNHIKESSNAFSSGDTRVINIEVKNDDLKIKERILDDFENAISIKNGYSLKANPNNMLYAKLVKYGDRIKIKEKDIAKEYAQYLKSIIKLYQG